LAGGPVFFHADFADDVSPSIFTSDALPTDTSLILADFDDASVNLNTTRDVVGGRLQDMTSFKIEAVPEPSTCGLLVLSLSALVACPRRVRAGRGGKGVPSR
jgi:hypothetical protein